jgi:hypothetical protein
MMVRQQPRQWALQHGAVGEEGRRREGGGGVGGRVGGGGAEAVQDEAFGQEGAVGGRVAREQDLQGRGYAGLVAAAQGGVEELGEQQARDVLVRVAGVEAGGKRGGREGRGGRVRSGGNKPVLQGARS